MGVTIKEQHDGPPGDGMWNDGMMKWSVLRLYLRQFPGFVILY